LHDARQRKDGALVEVGGDRVRAVGGGEDLQTERRATTSAAAFSKTIFVEVDRGPA